MAPLLVTLRTETEETEDTEGSRSTCPYEVLEGGSYAKHVARPKHQERKKKRRERQEEETDTEREGGREGRREMRASTASQDNLG